MQTEKPRRVVASTTCERFSLGRHPFLLGQSLSVVPVMKDNFACYPWGHFFPRVVLSAHCKCKIRCVCAAGIVPAHIFLKDCKSACTFQIFAPLSAPLHKNFMNVDLLGPYARFVLLLFPVVQSFSCNNVTWRAYA